MEKRSGIPDNAKRVFKGEIFEVWQWPQEMFDGSVATFEKVWRFPTVEVLAIVGDKIIVEEQDQPDRKNYITLISGRVDEGEDMLAAAKREMLEETGYQSENWELLFDQARMGKVRHDISYFIARNCKKVQEQHLDAGEKITMRLISFDELFALTEEPRFWVSPEFINFLLRLNMDPEKKEAFRKKLF